MELSDLQITPELEAANREYLNALLTFKLAMQRDASQRANCELMNRSEALMFQALDKLTRTAEQFAKDAYENA